MCAVKDDGRETTHDGERAEVDDECVVAEARSALGEEDAIVSGGANLLDWMRHVPRRDELTLLDVDRSTGFAGSNEKVCLAAKEGWNLEDIDSFRNGFAVRRFVHIGENGKTGFARETAKNARAFDKPWTAETMDAGAIGLVVAGLEDEGNMEIGSDALQRVCHEADVRFTFDDTRTGDEEEASIADAHRTDFKRVAHEEILFHRCERARESREPSWAQGSLRQGKKLTRRGCGTTARARARGRGAAMGQANRPDA